jgi:cardiolipin synthase A/B
LPLSAVPLPLLAEIVLDEEMLTTSLWSHAYTVGGVLLALVALSDLVRGERRQPVNTVAWLLAIILLPYVAAPLFLLLSGRKIRRLVARKRRVRWPAAPGNEDAGVAAARAEPTAQTFVAHGSGPPVGGNEVRLLTSGEEAWTELERCILGAQHSIHITTYILGRDAVGRRVVALLAQRASEGVQVRLQLDALGCFFSSGHFVQRLRDAGGEVARFLPVLPLSTRGSANFRNHRKIAVFDREVAILGGHNLAREYLGPTPWRKRWTDLGIKVRGPAAAQLDEVFLADWAFAAKRSLDELHAEEEAAAQRRREKMDTPAEHRAGSSPGGVAVQIVASGPDVPGDPLYEGMLAMIQEAKERVWIVTPYFVPDEVLLRSLMVKARAGRDVTLILPARSNHPVTDLARRPLLRQLVRAGGRVLAYQPRMLHAKALLVDDRLGLVGSANFDMRSLFVNFEIAALLPGEAEARALARWMEGLRRDCRPLGRGQLRRRRFPASMAEDFSRLIAPLL